MTASAKKFLDNISNWTTISEEDKVKILDAFKEVSIKKKKNLLEPKKVCNDIYFIVEGCLRSYYIDDKGIEHIYQISMDSNWISDLESFFSNKPSKYYIETLEDTQLFQISKENIEQLYKNVPSLERYFRILFQNAYMNALKRLNSTMWESAIIRYNDLLKEHPTLFQRVPLIYIASYLGITPESLSRIRKQKQA